MDALARWLVGAAAACAVALPGCYSETPKKSAPPSAGKAGPTVEAAGGHGTAGEGDAHEPGPALSAEDQALADAQKICPVSGEELGGEDMGPPVKEMVKGEPVFLCCKACVKKLHSDEDKYLAKVAELKKATAAEGRSEEKPKDE